MNFKWTQLNPKSVYTVVRQPEARFTVSVRQLSTFKFRIYLLFGENNSFPLELRGKDIIANSLQEATDKADSLLRGHGFQKKEV